jgi:hypothetical protein
MLLVHDDTRQHVFDFLEHRVKDYHPRAGGGNPYLAKSLAAIVMRKERIPERKCTLGGVSPFFLLALARRNGQSAPHEIQHLHLS